MLKGHKMPPPSAALPCLLLPSSPHYPFSLSPHTRSIFLDRFVPLSASLFGVSIPIASGILSAVAVRGCTNPTWRSLSLRRLRKSLVMITDARSVSLLNGPLFG
jgi:hypothetical protein